MRFCVRRPRPRYSFHRLQHTSHFRLSRTYSSPQRGGGRLSFSLLFLIAMCTVVHMCTVPSATLKEVITYTRYIMKRMNVCSVKMLCFVPLCCAAQRERERIDKRRDLLLFFEQEDRSMPSVPVICCDSRAPAQPASFVHLFLLVCVQETRQETR